MEQQVRRRRDFVGQHLSLMMVVLLAAACGGSGVDGLSAETPSTTATTANSAASSTTSTVAITESVSGGEPNDTNAASAELPVRTQLDWLVSVLNSGGNATIADVEEHLGPGFLAQVPADQVVAFLPQVFAVAEPPYVVESFESFADGTAAEIVLLGADGRRLSVELLVSAVEPNLIESMLIVPAESDFPDVVSFEDLDVRLAELGDRSSMGVYEVTSGECTAVHEIRADTSIVLGSVFKLWILAALAEEVRVGRTSWDETMAVSDALRSTPGGEIFGLETGAEVSLLRLATAMISISDNTATDMLLDRIGRESVEAAMNRSGVGESAANIPLLSTGNLFALKFVPDAPNANDYRDLDEAGKRELLDDLDDAVLPWVTSGDSLAELANSTNANGVPIGEPRDLDIEWFGTASDLCRTLLHLGELAEIPGLEPVASILEMNPGQGLPFDRERWPTIRFKGGSEPGVIAGAWWFEGANGERFVVAGGVANSEKAVDEINAIFTLASTIKLVS